MNHNINYEIAAWTQSDYVVLEATLLEEQVAAFDREVARLKASRREPQSRALLMSLEAERKGDLLADNLRLERAIKAYMEAIEAIALLPDKGYRRERLKHKLREAAYFSPRLSDLVERYLNHP